MNEIFFVIKRAVSELYQVEVTPEVALAPPNIDADYSSNIALKLAKNLHMSPAKIAEEIKQFLDSGTPKKDSGKKKSKQSKDDSEKKVTQKSPFKISVSSPGFINFISPDEYLWKELEADFETKLSQKYAGKTIICEFSDPNPFKVLHVGHLYTSIVGNAIANLFETAGAKVIRANFGGDVGLHVAKTMYALSLKLGLNLDEKNRTPNQDFEQKLATLKIEDIAESYIAGTAAYEDNPAAKETITRINKEIYQINESGAHGLDPKADPELEPDPKPEPNPKPADHDLAALYWRGRELSYEYFDAFYARIGVHFDKYYPESSVAKLGLETVLKQLAAGVYEKSDGAIIFNGEKYGLHTRVFVNQEGVPTYEAKDVGLIFTKWNDYHFARSVVITGNEQLDYMKVVLKSVEQYAPELVEKTTHLTHGLVKLPGNKKMSSRKGNFLKAVDVLDLVSSALKTEYNSDDWTVALAAVKYAFLKYKMGGNIIFDPQESVKMTGNSGPYLLYSCVRAKKILAQRERPETSKIPESLIPDERTLILKILDFRGTLETAISEMAPHKVAGYLYELAQTFSRFYENCPVVGHEREEIRLKIVSKYLETMTKGLETLGIEIPEEM